MYGRTVRYIKGLTPLIHPFFHKICSLGAMHEVPLEHFSLFIISPVMNVWLSGCSQP